MKSQIKPSLGLEVAFQSGLKIYFKSHYYKVKIHNKDFLKIKIDPSESITLKDIVSRVSECRSSLEWLYLPLDEVVIKEGVSTENL